MIKLILLTQNNNYKYKKEIMKRLLIISLLCFHLPQAYSQQEKKPLNEEMKELIFDQLFDNLDANFSIIVTPFNHGLINPAFIYNYTWVNNRKIFQDNNTQAETTIFKAKDLIKELDFNFFPEFNSDTTISLQARLKGKLLYDLKFKKNKGVESFIMSSPRKEFLKETKYMDGILNSMSTRTPSNQYMIGIETIQDSIHRKTTFDIVSKKYTIVDEIYKNKQLTKRTIYKKDTNKNKKKVKKIIEYKYNELGNISTETVLDNRSKKICSTQYYYTNSILFSKIKQKGRIIESFYYNYSKDKLDKLTYKRKSESENIEIEVDYNYNINGQINSLEIKKKGCENSEKFFFEYNSNSNLISMKEFIYNSSSDKISLKRSFSLSYFDNNIISSIKSYGIFGKLKKEVNFEFNYLNN